MIYAIKAVGTEYVKIGVSRGQGPRMTRIGNMQVGCPFELVLVAQVDWPHREEKRIHGHLKRHGLHVRGEWFSMSQETRIIIDLMRDGRAGLDAWYKRITPSNNRRLARILSITR
jgi:Meiotically up-regulated gene 113